MRGLAKVFVLVLVAAVAAGRPARASEMLTNEDIIKLVKEGGFPEDIVTQKIKSSECRFDVSTDAMLALKKAGVSDNIIKLMIDTHTGWEKSIKAAVQVALQGFKDSDPKQHERALRALKGLGAAAIPEITRQGLESEEPSVRAGSAEALGLIGHRDGLEPLFGVLVDRDETVRAQAARALKYTVSDDAKENLYKRLMDILRDMDVPRDGAVLALGHLGEKRAVEDLCKILSTSATPAMRRASAEALGLLGEGQDLLITAVLGDRDGETRVRAATSLAQIGDKEAILPLLKALSRFPQDRIGLIPPMSRFRDKRVVEALIEVLDENDSRMTEVAWEALKLLTGEKIGKIKQDWEDWWDLTGRDNFDATGK